jgi:predicted P-loop ATPase
VGDGDAFGVKCFSHDCSLKDILASVGLDKKQRSVAYQREIAFDYTDESGNLVFQAVRLPHPTKGKAFSQQRPDPANPGHFIKNLKGVTRVLYRLQRLKAAIEAGETILYVEGEKCVEAAERLGYTATTHAGGSPAKWEPQYGEALRGAHVVMLPDHDEPGEKFYRKVANGLRKCAASFVRVNLPGLGEKGDIVDWIKAGGTREDLDSLIDSARNRQGEDEPAPAPSAGDVEYVYNKEGWPRETQSNYETMLSQEAEWAGRLSYNIFKQTVEINGEPITDTDRSLISSWASREWRVTGGAFRVRDQAIAVIASQNAYDPLKDLVDNLPDWDGVKRLSGMLTRYCGADDNDVIRWTSRMMVAQMIARALDPGCMARYVVVLEGKELAGKSRFVKVLASDFYTSLTADLDSKESSMALKGVWVVEIEEMHSLRRSNRDKVKNFISVQIDDYVPKYANDKVQHPRRCVFIGTANNRDYLPSEPGADSNTRWFPVWTENLKIEDFESDRVQILAEAKAYYLEHKHDWYVIPENIKAALNDVRSERLEENLYEMTLSSWLEKQSVTYWEEIAEKCLGLPPDRWTRLIQMQVTDALKRMGWTKGGRQRIDGIRRNPWNAPDGWPPKEPDEPKEQNEPTEKHKF